MCAQPISVTDSSVQANQRLIALAEGWSRAEVNWEAKTESANIALAEKKPRFKSYFNIVGARIAARKFANNDLRKLTARANMAWLYNDLGFRKMAYRRYSKVAAQWKDSSNFDNAEIKPRARSSLFHLRMEAKHWEAYRHQRITRLTKFADESHQALMGFSEGEPNSHGLYSRWRGEKIPIFDDHRRILSACLLILPPVLGPAEIKKKNIAAKR